MVTGAVSALGSLASTLAVEKDWVLVVTSGEDGLLSQTNARLRRIDLCCKILAPMAVGVVMTYGGITVGAICIGIWNVVSVFPEFMLLRWVYKYVGSLNLPPSPPPLSFTHFSTSTPPAPSNKALSRCWLRSSCGRRMRRGRCGG